MLPSSNAKWCVREYSTLAAAVQHELAILSWIGRTVPEMAGASDADFAASAQLMCECEDIYAKLTRYQPTTRQPVKCSPEELQALWTTTDRTVHNREQGLRVNLAMLDAFGTAAPGATDGRFTASGVTIGECKLYATLHTLSLIDADVLRPHPFLAAFCERFAALEPTRAVVDAGGEMPAKFEQYFVAG